MENCNVLFLRMLALVSLFCQFPLIFFGLFGQLVDDGKGVVLLLLHIVSLFTILKIGVYPFFKKTNKSTMICDAIMSLLCLTSQAIFFVIYILPVMSKDHINIGKISLVVVPLLTCVIYLREIIKTYKSTVIR